MRSSGLRGGGGAEATGAAGCFAAEGCGVVLEAVGDVVDEADDGLVPGDVAEGTPGVIGKPVVALMPGGVRGRGRGAALCADGKTGALRRAGGRRFILVETKPVVPAPEPGAVVKLRGCLSRLLVFGIAPAGRASRRAGRRCASNRGY
jgi:hypothetical protein